MCLRDGFRAERDPGFAFDQQDDVHHHPASDVHGNTKGAPYGISCTNCLATGHCALLPPRLGIYPGRRLRIPIHPHYPFRRNPAPLIPEHSPQSPVPQRSGRNEEVSSVLFPCSTSYRYRATIVLRSLFTLIVFGTGGGIRQSPKNIEFTGLELERF